jgi:hypothetical protein
MVLQHRSWRPETSLAGEVSCGRSAGGGGDGGCAVRLLMTFRASGP